MLSVLIRRRLFVGSLLLAVGLGGSETLRAQDPDQAQQAPPGSQTSASLPLIRSIDVQYVGPVTITRDRVLAQMRTRVGQPYSSVVAEADIRSIYSTGLVDNVRIFGEKEGNGVRVIVSVQSRSLLGEVEIVGASRLKAKALRGKLGVRLNAPINETNLEEGRQKIIDTYQARGFTDVDVQYRVVPVEGKRAVSRVIYTVVEGTKGAISRIEFEGNAHISTRTLRRQMKTKGRTFIYFLDKSGRLDQTQLQQDLQSVREYYQNHGFVDMTVREVRKERTPKGALYIIVSVDEGPMYRVGSINFTGYKQTTEARLRAFTKLKPGMVFSPEKVKDDAKKIADSYGSGGYVDLGITPVTTPGAPGTINITYDLREGQRSFVQRINIVGNTRTKDKVIRREVLIIPGDTFNTVRVERSKKRLENLGYFSRVDTFPVDTGVEGRKDLEINLDEKRTGSLNFGAGFSTVDSLVGFVELTQGNFDLLGYPNFTGGGQKFRARIQVGGLRQDVEVTLVEPWFLDRPLSLGGSVFYHNSSYLSSLYDERDYGFSINARKSLATFVSADLGYRLESIEIYNVPITASPSIQSEAGQSTKSQVTGTLVYDHRDSPILTRTGERVSLTTYIAGGFLQGTEQIYGFDLEASKYFHLPWDGILLFNAEVASVDNWGSGSRIRIYDRLFLGGSNNLRGFNFRDVGPKDNFGEPLGGRTLERATVEYTFPLFEKARGAVFYDTGLVNDDSYDFGTHSISTFHKKHPERNTTFDNLASDVGIGVRLELPIGPLRIDYGIPLQKDGNKGSGKFNFNVGYQF